MLDLLNRYAHGLVAVPIFNALRVRGAIIKLYNLLGVSPEQLTRELAANPWQWAAPMFPRAEG